MRGAGILRLWIRFRLYDRDVVVGGAGAGSVSGVGVGQAYAPLHQPPSAEGQKNAEAQNLMSIVEDVAWMNREVGWLWLRFCIGSRFTVVSVTQPSEMTTHGNCESGTLGWEGCFREETTRNLAVVVAV